MIFLLFGASSCGAPVVVLRRAVRGRDLPQRGKSRWGHQQFFFFFKEIFFQEF